MRLLAVASILLLPCAAASSSLESDHPPRILADDDDDKPIIAQYTNDDGKATLLTFDTDGEFELEIRIFRLAAIKVPAADLDSIVEELKADDNIEAVVADFERTIGPPVHEPIERDEEERRRRKLRKESVEYGIEMVQADKLFDIADEAPGEIKVCVVDTGIEDGHEDLPSTTGNAMTGADGFRLTGIAGTWDNDGNGHGTHCAGVIGAIGDNDMGVVGVRKNPDLFTFHIGKGLSDAGGGLTSNIMRALGSCYEQGAKVISMSLGGPLSSEVEAWVYKFLYDENILVVAAAGNSGEAEHSFPASYPTVVSVAAVNKKEKLADFSQRNDQVELAGPGVEVYSTYIGNSYASLSGTSMACPHVAGIAAEVWSHFPDCTNNQIRNVLIQTAKNGGSDDDLYDARFGYGIVQGKAAYDLLKAEGCEAGGPVQDPLSAGALGGCFQDPNNPVDCENLDLSGPSTARPTSCHWFVFAASSVLVGLVFQLMI